MKIDDVQPCPKVILVRYVMGLRSEDEVFELNEVCARLALINNTWIRRILIRDKELSIRSARVGATAYVGSPKAILKLKRKFA